MSSFVVLIAVLVYAAFSLLYGAQIYLAGLREGKDSKAALRYALLRGWQKPAETLFKTLRSMVVELFASIKSQ